MTYLYVLGTLVLLVTHSPPGDLCNFPCAASSSSLAFSNHFFLISAKMSEV